MRRIRHTNLLATLVIVLLSASSLSFTSVEAQAPPPPPRRLRVNHYGSTVCKNVENVVRDEVAKKAMQDPTIIPALLRIYFHDCFADRQCDASLLIKTIKGVKTELDSSSNNGVQGLDFIDFLKTKVLASCKGVHLVSCADIIALATRDAVALASKRPRYVIPTGRLDGKVSRMEDANTLPGSRTFISTIVKQFADAGFSAEETVVLSGAHSIGKARCKFFNDRLHNFFNSKRPDRTMDPNLVAHLSKTCTSMTTNLEKPVFLDQGTTTVLDKSYFTQIVRNRGVLQSDQNLLTNAATKDHVRSLAAGTEGVFLKKFEDAMIKLGNLGVATVVGAKGDIRKVCSVLN